MYIRVVWGRLQGGSWDEYERHYRDRVAEATKGVKGLRERQLVRSTEDPDEGMSLTFWDTLDDMLQFDRSDTRQELVRQVEHLYRGEYWVKHFEVQLTDDYK